MQSSMVRTVFVIYSVVYTLVLTLSHYSQNTEDYEIYHNRTRREREGGVFQVIIHVL